MDAAVRDGAIVLTIDCTPSTGNTPLFPVGVLLRRIANITSASTEEEKLSRAQHLLIPLLTHTDMTIALTYLAPLFGLQSDVVPTKLDPVEVREQTVSVVSRLLSGVAGQRPLVLICEDLHWVDDTTAKVIARICLEIGRLRALMIVTTRPTSDEPRLDLSNFIEIALQPFDRSTAADLIRSVARAWKCLTRPFDESSIGAKACRLFWSRSLILLSKGRADTPSPAMTCRHHCNSSSSLVWGGGRSSPPSCNRHPSLVANSRFVLLEKLVPRVAEVELAQILEVLAREGVFAEPDANSRDRARFKHAMICEAVYETLLGSDRQRLHSGVADLLNSDFKGTPDAAPDLIAEHLRRACRFEEAIQVASRSKPRHSCAWRLRRDRGALCGRSLARGQCEGFKRACDATIPAPGPVRCCSNWSTRLLGCCCRRHIPTRPCRLWR